MRHTIRQELHGVVIFLALLWVIRIADVLLPIDLNLWGIRPRTLSGLVGIPLAPFLHEGIGHLLSNTLPLAILLVLLAGSRASSWQIVLQIILLGGFLLWLLDRSSSTHVGASGLVFGLIAFLIVSGFLERRLTSLAIALLVGFLYGSTLLFGVLPSLDQRISWEGHLLGAVAGAVIAYLHTGRPLQVDSEALTKQLVA
jgi:membrane associated rhomboid family serine protease